MELDTSPDELPGFGRMELHAKQRLENNNDIKVIVVGSNSETGVGKSTLAIQLCRRLDPEWEARSGSFMNVGKYINAYLDTPPGSALLLDEIEAAADSRRAMSEDNVKLSQAWAQLRSRNVATVATLPTVSMLDNRLLELADYWVLVKKRGVAQPFRIRVNDFNGKIQRLGLGPEQDEHIMFPDLPDDDPDKEFLDNLNDEAARRDSMKSISIEEHEKRKEKAVEKAKRKHRDEWVTTLVEETDMTLREIAGLEPIDVSHRRVGQIAQAD